MIPPQTHGNFKLHKMDDSNCLKATLLKTFFWELSKTSKTAVFPNFSCKLSGVIFLKAWGI